MSDRVLVARKAYDDSREIRPVICGWAQELTAKGMIEPPNRLRFRQDRGIVAVPSQYGLLDAVDIHTAHAGTAILELNIDIGTSGP